ncbi:MAG: hypothetical protein ABI867_42635 [Kofleriaceae bacterium]
MTKWIASAFLCTGLAFACGGGDGGVDSDVLVADLSDDEAADECAFLVDEHPPFDVDCDGTTVTIGFDSDAECVGSLPTDPACDVTVGEFEDCFDDLDDAADEDICAADFPVSCDALMAAECN